MIPHLDHAQLTRFVPLSGLAEHGIPEWVLTDPATREPRGTGFFTDLDILSMAIQPYLGSFNLEVARNPRPVALARKPGASHHFQRIQPRPTPLESMELITSTVLCFRPRDVRIRDGRSIVEAVRRLVERLDIACHIEVAAHLVNARVRFDPMHIASLGGPDGSRRLFAQFEEHVRESLTPDERQDLDLAAWSGPDLHDPVPGAYLMAGGQPVPVEWGVPPVPILDSTVPRMLGDLMAGRTLRSATPAHGLAPRMEGLILNWQMHHEDISSFEDGSGQQRGKPPSRLAIESDVGKHSQTRMGTLESKLRESIQAHLRRHQLLPFPSRPLTQFCGGGLRPGQIALLSSRSWIAASDWAHTTLENLARSQDIAIVVLSTRRSPAGMILRATERLAGLPLESIEGLDQPGRAGSLLEQVRAQFRRPPFLPPLSPDEDLGHALAKAAEILLSREDLLGLPALLVIDGWDDFSTQPGALRRVRHLAEDAPCAVVLVSGTITPFNPPGVDLHLRLWMGDEELRAFVTELPESHPGRPLALRLLPRIIPESQNGRTPGVLQAVNPAVVGDLHAWVLHHPSVGRFQNVQPRSDG